MIFPATENSSLHAHHSMNHEVISVLGKDVVKVEYKGQRVVTLKQIDDLHGTPKDAAFKQFDRHRSRYVVGTDYFFVPHSQNSEIRSFGIDVPARGLLVFTERGYGKINPPFRGCNNPLAHTVLQNAR